MLYNDVGGWDGRVGGKRYMYTYNRLTLLYSRNEHRIVKQLHANLKKKRKSVRT